MNHDDGINIQIRQGVAIGDMVAVNVGQSAREGETVQPVSAAAN